MYGLGLLLMMVTVGLAKKGPCFDFPGDTFLEFKPSNFNVSHHAHYRLQFQTREPEGVVLYGEGPDDYEALYVSGGKLVYLLTNPSPSGVEGTSGGLYISQHSVNSGNWITVDLWRNWESRKSRHVAAKLRTGMELRDAVADIEERHVDDVQHRGVCLHPHVYIGGVSPALKHTNASATSYFVGRIKEIHEKRNDIDFEMYTLNFGQKVQLCN